MSGPTQDNRNKGQGHSPSTGTMDGNSKPPPDLSKESFGPGPQKVRDDYTKEQTKDQQAMTNATSKGHGQPAQSQSQQQRPSNTQNP